MEYAQFVRTQLKRSRLCLGTANFGLETSEDDWFAIMIRVRSPGFHREWIARPCTTEQLTESLHTVEIKFSKGQLKRLDQIRPGPNGESPEAFAW